MPLYNYLDIARGALDLSSDDPSQSEPSRDGRALPRGDLPLPRGDLPQDLRDYLVELAQALQPYGISLSEPHNWPVVLAVTLFYRRVRGKRRAQAKTARVRTC